jgi:hypothetical protein
MLLASIRTPVMIRYVFLVRFDGEDGVIYLFNTVQTLVYIYSIKHVTFSDPSTGLVSFVFECNINKVLLKTIFYILLSTLYLKQYLYSIVYNILLNSIL